MIRQHHRFDQDRSARRARAQAHLARVRGRRDHGEAGPPAGPALRVGRLALGVALVAAALGAWQSDALVERIAGPDRRVERIAVRGAARLAPSEVAAATGVPAGAALREADPERIARSLESHDWIGRARALRLPGGTLVVEVREREPVATVALADQLYAVDTDGEPFAPVTADALPRLVHLLPQQEIRPREPSPRLATAARLARRLPELGLVAPTRVRIASDADPEGFALELTGLGAVVVLGHDDLDARLDAFAQLVAARPDVVAGATSIDLRFADQVVLRSEPARDGSAQRAAGRGDVGPQKPQPTG